MENKKKKVIVGLSGGVDSAASLIRLIEQGYDVEAMFMRNWDSSLNGDVLGNPHVDDSVCPQEVDYMDALKVCEKLNVKLHRVDFVSEYWDKVFSYFLTEYEKCRTPNPDILCNKEIKFKCFLDHALELGCDYIAMGHYARVDHENNHALLRGLDNNKDQTYFLSQLTKAQLEKVLFPVGDMQKSDVRKLCEKYGLEVATKKDSTGVCFIGERNFKQFLKNYIPSKEGNIVTMDGKVVGHHDGVMYYTIGQRKGLNIGGSGDAWFVCGKNAKTNELLVQQGLNDEYVYSNRCIVTNINYLGDDFKTKEMTCKFRYRQADVSVCVNKISDDTFEVLYPQKVKAVTPGQACVFYDGEVCLGGGVIDKVYMNDELRMY